MPVRTAKTDFEHAKAIGIPCYSVGDLIEDQTGRRIGKRVPLQRRLGQNAVFDHTMSLSPCGPHHAEIVAESLIAQVRETDVAAQLDEVIVVAASTSFVPKTCRSFSAAGTVNVQCTAHTARAALR